MARCEGVRRIIVFFPPWLAVVRRARRVNFFRRARPLTVPAV